MMQNPTHFALHNLDNAYKKYIRELSDFEDEVNNLHACINNCDNRKEVALMIS